MTSGYLPTDEAPLPGFRHLRRITRGGWAADQYEAAEAAFEAVSITPVTTFSVRFLGCKVSHTDAQEVRERLLADGHVERGLTAAPTSRS